MEPLKKEAPAATGAGNTRKQAETEHSRNLPGVRSGRITSDDVCDAMTAFMVATGQSAMEIKRCRGLFKRAARVMRQKVGRSHG